MVGLSRVEDMDDDILGKNELMIYFHISCQSGTLLYSSKYAMYGVPLAYGL